MECYDVVNRKFPKHTIILDKLLASLGYELIAAPRAGLEMTDPKDAPILNAAILADVDILISGDGHFLALDIEYPKVLSPAQYLKSQGLQ
jgi:predicted nucleic acid-binding protein